MVIFAVQTIKMELNKDTTLKIAQLAKLSFSEEELESIQQDLSQMIGFVEKLNEIDTTGIVPLTHITETSNRLREDVVEGSIPAEEAFLNAPSSSDHFFTVPKVIKK
jgi:aspartyl-tRNA(Asn)/glutamyl-tRNA(Gln) amidotransferase subunit C